MIALGESRSVVAVALTVSAKVVVCPSESVIATEVVPTFLSAIVNAPPLVATAAEDAVATLVLFTAML